mgnify:CR=1 FL=1
MLKKTMTYEDYNGVPRTEDFYFNLTPAEVTEMELSVDGGLVEMINRVVAAQGRKADHQRVQGHHPAAYGEKSPDGKRFVKNQEIRDAFAQTTRTATCSWSWPPTPKPRPHSSTASSSSRRRPPRPPRRTEFEQGGRRCWNLWCLNQSSMTTTAAALLRPRNRPSSGALLWSPSNGSEVAQAVPVHQVEDGGGADHYVPLHDPDPEC